MRAKSLGDFPLDFGEKFGVVIQVLGGVEGGADDPVRLVGDPLDVGAEGFGVTAMGEKIVFERMTTHGLEFRLHF
jgi:hypothetical protein